MAMSPYLENENRLADVITAIQITAIARFPGVGVPVIPRGSFQEGWSVKLMV